MKKKLAWFLLALLLLTALFPASVFAVDIRRVTVGGVDAINDPGNLPAGVSFDGTDTLEFDGATINTASLPDGREEYWCGVIVRNMPKMTIVLKGSNTISVPDTPDDVYKKVGLFLENTDLTIKGDGSLTITTTAGDHYNYGIYSDDGGTETTLHNEATLILKPASSTTLSCGIGCLEDFSGTRKLDLDNTGVIKVDITDENADQCGISVRSLMNGKTLDITVKSPVKTDSLCGINTSGSMHNTGNVDVTVSADDDIFSAIAVGADLTNEGTLCAAAAADCTGAVFVHGNITNSGAIEVEIPASSSSMNVALLCEDGTLENQASGSIRAIGKNAVVAPKIMLAEGQAWLGSSKANTPDSALKAAQVKDWDVIPAFKSVFVGDSAAQKAVVNVDVPPETGDVSLVQILTAVLLLSLSAAVLCVMKAGRKESAC